MLIFLGEKFTNRIAKELTINENCNTKEKFHRSLVLKMVIFHCVKCIIPTLYLAWILYHNKLGLKFSNKDTWYSNDVILQGNVIVSIFAKLFSDIILYYIIPLNGFQREGSIDNNKLEYLPCKLQNSHLKLILLLIFSLNLIIYIDRSGSKKLQAKISKYILFTMGMIFPNEVPFSPILIIIYLNIIKRFEIYLDLYVYRRSRHEFNNTNFLYELKLYINYYIIMVPISLIISIVLYVSKESVSSHNLVWKLVFFILFSWLLFVSIITFNYLYSHFNVR